ncbi:Protein FAR1-RELATED SEQUENCE 5 [Linum perenne]
MQGGAVKFLLDYFLKQANSNKGNYSKIKIDKEENAQIESIFCAYAQMRGNYLAFGDCFSFDTTYRTNKHHRPLGQSLLVKHTTQMCVFGTALLYEETTKSFEWLFATFLVCMDGRQPNRYSQTHIHFMDFAPSIYCKMDQEIWENSTMQNSGKY